MSVTQAIEQTSVLNWLRLEQLQRQATQRLVQFFQRRWLQSMRQPWKDCDPVLAALLQQQISQKAWSTLGKIQQQQIIQGDTAYWDITTLTFLLTSAPKLLPAANKDKQVESKHWKALRTFRNAMAHHPSKTFTVVEFETHWNNVYPTSMWLGTDADTLQQLRSSIQPGGVAVVPPIRPIDMAAEEKAIVLRTAGNSAHEQQRYDEAIQLYSEALLFPLLSDDEYAKLLSNRSASYLARHVHLHPEEITSEALSCAENDAKEARGRCPHWWRPHFRLGRVRFQQEQLQRAMDAFDKALTLHPGHQESIDLIHLCRQRIGQQERREVVDQQQQANRDAKGRQQLKETIGMDVHSADFTNFVDQLDPATGHVVRGHCFRDGIGKEQNYIQAADQYAKAAQLRNAEGMYALGQLYFHGHIGNRPDYKSALKWFRAAAANPPVGTVGLRNIGVAEAQHSLGLCYDEGIGVEASVGMALEWYQKSSSNGSADAANNLGVHHLRKSELDQAQQYWELSASRGCVKAMESLSELCLRRHDHHMAVEWNTRAAAHGSTEAAARAQQFSASVQQKKKEMQDNKLVEWEHSAGLSSNGYSWEQRSHRWLASTLSPTQADAISNSIRARQSALQRNPTPTHLEKGPYKYDVEMLEKHQAAGSETARRMLNAVRCFLRAIAALEAEDYTRMVLELGECLLLEHIVASMHESVKERVKRGIDLVLSKCRQMEPHKLDEYARICYACVHMEQVEHTIRFLQLCIARYPKTSFFHQLRGAMHGFLKQFDAGVRHLNDALVLSPDNPQLLYEHAAMLRLSDHSDPEMVIACYSKYLDVCPVDDRKVPEACYAIATQHLLIAKNDGVNGLSSSKVLKWYGKGQEAEAQQLPCFLPYVSSNKDSMDRMMRMWEVFGRKDEAAPMMSSTPPMLWKPPGRFTHPKRVELIKANRGFQRTVLDTINSTRHSPFTTPPSLLQEAPKSLVGLQNLLLSDMDPTHEKVWDGYVLSLTVIDMAYITTPSIQLVVEDNHGNTERLFIYNYPPHEAEYLMRDRFVVGCQLAVINPYLRLAMDGKPGVRLDDYKSIVSHPLSEAEKAVCWYCLTNAATKVCAKCHLARYCSKNCQRQDWKAYDHKRLCKGLLSRAR